MVCIRSRVSRPGSREKAAEIARAERRTSVKLEITSAHSQFGNFSRLSRMPRPITREINDGTTRLLYDLKMHQCWLYLVTVASLLSVSACHPTPKPKPVVVHVFRDLHSPFAYQLDHRILEFQASNPRLPSGAPIVIKTYDDMDYDTALKSHFDRDLRVDVVILNAATDAAQNPGIAANLAHAVDICAAAKTCPTNVPAFVPSSATGAPAEAGQIFLKALSQHK